MGDEELSELKKVYDELWRDAKTLIKDMNSNITTVFLFGITMLALSIIEIGTATEMYSRIAAGSTEALDFFYLAATAFGSIVSAIAGVMMLRWYSKLKNRYANLIQLEKTIED